MVRISPQVREVMRGFSVDELHQLLTMRDEILAILQGPAPERNAIAWLERRHAAKPQN